MHMLMVSLGGLLVKSESTSKLPIQKLLSSSKISLVKEKESLTVNLLIAKKLSIGTKNIATLQMVVPIE